MKDSIPFKVSESNFLTSEEFFNEFFQNYFIKKTFTLKLTHEDFKVKLIETKTKYMVEADLRDFHKNDIEIEYINKFLVISAENHKFPKVKKQIKQGISLENFRRMFYLGNIDDKNIHTYYDKGFLTIVLLKV